MLPSVGTSAEPEAYCETFPRYLAPHATQTVADLLQLWEETKRKSTTSHRVVPLGQSTYGGPFSRGSLTQLGRTRREYITPVIATQRQRYKIFDRSEGESSFSTIPPLSDQSKSSNQRRVGRTEIERPATRTTLVEISTEGIETAAKKTKTITPLEQTNLPRVDANSPAHDPHA